MRHSARGTSIFIIVLQTLLAARPSGKLYSTNARTVNDSLCSSSVFKTGSVETKPAQMLCADVPGSNFAGNTSSQACSAAGPQRK